MKRLNQLSEQLTMNEDNKKTANPFIPELIDIMCPDAKRQPSQNPININTMGTQTS